MRRQSYRRSSVALSLVVAGFSACGAGTVEAATLLPQDIVDAIFPKTSNNDQPLAISLSRNDGDTPDPACGLAPADLKESRGDKTRIFKLLIKAPATEPLRPTEAFLKFRRLTVDADGSGRAYHPDDPLGVGVCKPEGKSQACAVDELPNAGIRLFEGTNEVKPHRTPAERAGYLKNWGDTWTSISKRRVLSLNHGIDGRIPKGYELYYFAQKNSAVVFKTTIIPFSKGMPCIRPLVGDDPGYFVASTTFKNDGFSSEAMCKPASYLDASRVPFIVLPGAVFGQLQVGDVAVGFAQSDNGNRIVFGIVGDTGPFYKLTEGSIAFNSQMIGRDAPLANSTEQKFIDIDLDDTADRRGHITAMGILILGGTRAALGQDFSAGNIAKVGKRLLRKWGNGQKPEARLASCLAAATENPHTVP